ncbi:MAG: DUF2232 domain-containing protein [Erysipelotrichales bacterium]|nr:MAG: DUF2232 domain-containing protein [Erysipelotrichales bacterium]
MRKSVRQITDGAMMIALIGLFVIVNRQLLFLLETYVAFLMPIPILFYTVKYGFKQGLVVAFGMIVISLLLGTPQSLFYMGAALANGLVYGHGVRKQKPNEWLLGVTIVITAATMFLTTYAFAAFFGYNVMEEVGLIIDYLKTIQGFTIDATLTATLYAMYPLVIMVTALIQSILTHLSAILLMKRLRIAVLPLRPIHTMRISKPIGGVALLLLFAPAVFQYMKVSVDIQVMGNIVYLIALMIFLFETFIFLGLLAPKVKIRSLPTLGLLLYLLLPTVMTYVCVVIGALDILTDFRERVLYRR